MARSKQFDEQQALVAAMRLFWAKGYGAASIQDLEAVTGLTRTSLYNAYGNKNSLFKKALGLYIALVQEKFQQIVMEAPTAREAIRGLLEAVIDLHFSKDSPGGCLVVLSVMESNQHDAETMAMAEAMFQAEQRILVEILEKGRERGELDAALPVAATATALAAAASGMVVLAKARIPAARLSEMVQATLRLLDR
ncbi:MAG: TetR/AcrR family transcriptional regulator [Thermodesulfobacteriota bacterium]